MQWYELLRQSLVRRSNKSHFLPLNVYEEDIIEDAEQHTRELQVGQTKTVNRERSNKIEEGLKLFRKALEAQKEGEFKVAKLEYEKLFGLEVLKLSYVRELQTELEQILTRKQACRLQLKN
jgi:hypothetical protein